MTRNAEFSISIIARVLVLSILVFGLCSCDRSEKHANDLFAKATQSVSKARLFQDTHPNDALELYEDARMSVETIYASYHTTTIAKQLQSGTATLDGLSVKDLRLETIPQLKLLVESQVDPLRLVEALIPRVPSALAQAQLAQRLAKKFIKSHRPDEAMQQIKVALRAIDGIGSYPDQINLLLNLAIDYNELGIKDKTLEVTFRALTLAKQLPAPETRQKILSEIAFTYYRAGAEQKGYEAIRSIQDSRKEQETLRVIAERLGGENLYMQAIPVTTALRDTPAKVLFLAELGAQAIDKDLCEPAQVFINSASKLATIFSDSNDEARLWLQTAHLLHRCGKDDESLSILDKAVHASDEGRKNANYAETAALISSLAGGYAELGQSDTALSLIASSLPIAQRERSQHSRDRVFADIAITLSRLKEFDRADKVLASIKGVSELAHAVVIIAPLYHAAGQTERALELLSGIKNNVKEVLNPEDRTTILLGLRDAYFELKQLDRALEVGFLLREYGESWRKHIRSLNEKLVSFGEISLALRLAREVDDPFLAGVLLADIARFQAKHGSRSEAVALMEEAFRISRSGSDEKRKSAMTQYFAEALLLMKWPKEASDLVNANKIDNKPLWFARIAEAYADAGEKDAAIRSLHQALLLSAEMTPLENQIQTLIEIASIYSLVGLQPDSASQEVLQKIFRDGFSIKTTEHAL